MVNNKDPLSAGQNALTPLAEYVEANRGEFIKHCKQVLRENLFSNRAEISPQSLAVVATQQADSFISFLRNPGSVGQEHGVSLCRQGLSSQSVVGLCQAHFEFLHPIFFKDPGGMALIFTYLNTLLEGFFDAREKLILKEQENFRLAFQMALNRSNAEIEDARSVAQRATELSYRRVIMAQEDERRRISRELHDEAGQALVGIRMSLENISRDLPDLSPAKRENIEKAIFWTDDAAQRIRSLAYSLRPPMLDLLGINLTIKQLCIEFAEQTRLIIRYSGEELPLLSEELSISLYRFVQEALTNIARHSSAKHAWVKLRLEQAGIKLSVLDDGQGFDPKTTDHGLGLNGMKERLGLLNGWMEIESAPGNSTLLSFYLPLIIKTGS